MIRLEDLTEKVHSYNPKADVDIIWQAYVFSAKVHRGQVRLSGSPYLSHPLEVAYLLAHLKMDSTTVAAGLLHDTVEDTYTTLDEIREVFGEEMIELVDGVTKISKMQFASSEQQQAENVRKMILAMAKDIRVVIIKLADRLHNMRTLEHLSVEKQRRIAQETLDIYAPIANRLGIGWVKIELEETAFRYLQPKIYSDLAMRVTKGLGEREKYIEEVRSIMSRELEKAGIPGGIEGRPKHFFSIYHKMITQNISFDEVYDLQALRIITDSVRSCYAILGIIHSLWKPIPGKVKDYIAMPKSNMYQSLHTSVMGPAGERVEFQIRTEEMHQTAEEGIAAHWRYKEGGKRGEYDARFTWLRHLLEWQQDLQDPREFMRNVKVDLVPEEVYVFTPKGDVKSLPTGSTPVDFAYTIHTDIGHRCVGAKVNGKLVPLRYQLENGDIIEILTTAHHVPSRDWLKFVKSSRARAKIKAFINAQEKERSISLGREILEKELKRYNISMPKPQKLREEMGPLAGSLGFQSAEDLLASVGYGKVSVQQVVTVLVPPEKIEERRRREDATLRRAVEKVAHKTAEDGVKVGGADDILIRYAKCCNPVPGDKIVGFITRGRGVSIHTEDCPDIASLEYDPARKISVEWDVEKTVPHPVKIAVTNVDKPGMLAQISAAISSCNANISQANIYTTEEKKGFLDFVVEIYDLAHLEQVIRAIQEVKGVLRVERVRDLPQTRVRPRRS